jgi:hypothetical protein
MGNYSKDPEEALHEALKKGYDRVRFQQGKPILDRELNLLGDLSSAQRLAPYIGNGVPTGGKGGLMAVPPPDPAVVDFELLPGRCIVGGLEVTLNDATSYTKQPHQENLQNTWPFEAFSKGAKEGRGYVYLRVFLSEVDDTADTDLQNQDDIGFETTLREKADWELLVSGDRLDGPAYFLLAEYYASGQYVEQWTDRRVTRLTLETLRTDFEEFKEDVVTKTASLNPSGELAANSVGNINIKDNAVSATKIQDGSVTNTKLGPNAVTTPKLADASVGTQKLQDLSVHTTKLQDGSVTNPKLANGAVDAAKLAVGAVDSARLAAGAVTYGKLGPSSVTVAQFKYLTTLNANFSLNAGITATLTLLPKAFINAENFLIYNVWSDNDLSWSESMVNGNRLLKVTNNSGVVTTVNVVARLIVAS